MKSVPTISGIVFFLLFLSGITLLAPASSFAAASHGRPALLVVGSATLLILVSVVEIDMGSDGYGPVWD